MDTANLLNKFLKNRANTRAPDPEPFPTSDSDFAASDPPPMASTPPPPPSRLCGFKYQDDQAEFELHSVTPQMLLLQFNLKNLNFTLHRHGKVFKVANADSFLPPLPKSGLYTIVKDEADSSDASESDEDYVERKPSVASLKTEPKAARKGASPKPTRRGVRAVSIYRNLEAVAEEFDNQSVVDWQPFAPEDVPWLEITNDDGETIVAKNVQHLCSVPVLPLEAEKYFVVHPDLSLPGHIFNQPEELERKETPLQRAFCFLPPYLYVSVRVLSLMSKNSYPEVPTLSLDDRGRQRESRLFYPQSLNLSLYQLTQRVNDVFKQLYRLLYQFDKRDRMESEGSSVLQSIKKDMSIMLDQLLLALEDGDEVFNVAKQVLRHYEPNLRGITALLQLEKDTHTRFTRRKEKLQSVGEDVEEHKMLLHSDNLICPEATETEEDGHVLRAAHTRKDLKNVHVLMQKGCSNIYDALEMLELAMQVLENFYAQCRRLYRFVLRTEEYYKFSSNDSYAHARLMGMEMKYMMVLRTFSNLIKRNPFHLDGETDWAQCYDSMQNMQHMLEVLFVKPRDNPDDY